MYKTPPGGEGGLLPAQGLYYLAYWDTDLNKSVDFFLNPICILFVVCTRQLLFVL